MLNARGSHGLARLSNGDILAIGGFWADGTTGGALAVCDRYNIQAQAWQPAPSLNVPRRFDMTAAMSNVQVGGVVYVFGGMDNNGTVLASAEKFAPPDAPAITSALAATGTLGQSFSYRTRRRSWSITERRSMTNSSD